MDTFVYVIDLSLTTNLAWCEALRCLMCRINRYLP